MAFPMYWFTYPIASTQDPKEFKVGDAVCTKAGPRQGSGKVTAITSSDDITVEFSDGVALHFEKTELAHERPCPIPTCGRMNEEGVRTCWSCGNGLVGSR